MRACLQSLDSKYTIPGGFLLKNSTTSTWKFFEFKDHILCPTMAAVHSEMNHGKKLQVSRHLLPR